MTIGELARWFVETLRLDVDHRVIPMDGWLPNQGPGYGWPLSERCWVNPSPNAPNLWMARCYPGTAMLEGTTLSEGRGSTRPLELFGAPDLDARALLAEMRTSSRALLFDEHAALLGMAQEKHPQDYPQPGWVEHDPVCGEL